MYDGHIYCKEYKEIKDMIVDILNNDVSDYDIDEIETRIQELYDSGKMSSTQYDDLMGYCMDLH